MTEVMTGIRVLEVAEHTFVPAASAILSDWGADVIKIEPTGRGDAMRAARTGVMDLGGGGVHPLLEHSNRGKQSLALDLTKPEAREILYRLAELSDVFLTNKLPRVRRDLAIDVDTIRAHNPRIVYVSGSGYGEDGPDADNGGYDILGYWCRAGVSSGVNSPGDDEFVTQPGPAYGDSIGAMTIAGGIAAALLHRERSGQAPVVDVSLLATGMWSMGSAIALALHTGTPWQAVGRDISTIANPLARAYRAKDGRWVQLSCLQAFRYWPDMCAAIGREDLLRDDRFGSHEDLTANAPAAAELLQQTFLLRTADEWRARLQNFSGQWAIAEDTIEVAHDPQVEANGYLVSTETAGGTPFSLVAAPVRFDGVPSSTARAPEFNEHGDHILTEVLGLEWDDVVALKLKGAVE